MLEGRLHGCCEDRQHLCVPLVDAKLMLSEALGGRVARRIKLVIGYEEVIEIVYSIAPRIPPGQVRGKRKNRKE